MRYKTINKDKPEVKSILVKNVESSASIPIGTPVVFKMAGDSTDGLGVVLPSSSTAVKAHPFFAGIINRTIAAGELGEAIVSGFVLNGLLCRGTRSATTAAWPSWPAIAQGDVLTIDTVANAAMYTAVGAAAAANPVLVYADTANTAASTTTAASNAYTQWSAATAATILAKMLVRCM